MTLSAVDLFAGAGGLTLGIEQAGFEVHCASDIDRASVDTYKSNFHHHVLHSDIREITPQDVLDTAGLRSGELDLLAGGPPCQGFSVQRRGGDSDPRNELVNHYVDMVLAIRPSFFLMENVGGLLSRRGKPFVASLIGRCQEAGFAVHVSKLNAVDYGTPQLRKRVFLVGELLDQPGCEGVFQFPNPSHSPDNYRTVRDAIGDLPSPPLNGDPHPDFNVHYREGRLSEINRERFLHIPEGGGRDDLPQHLQLKCHTDNPNHRHKDVYGRMWWDRPAPTITARFDSFSRGRFGHPVEDRTITLREGARLQGFPDTFYFVGNREEVARQIGNAVPIPLAVAVARAIRTALEAKAADSLPLQATLPLSTGTVQ